MSIHQTPENRDAAYELWEDIFRDVEGYLCIATYDRAAEKMAQRFFLYPENADEAQDHALDEAARGRDAYFCAHLLHKQGGKLLRRKDYAAPIRALWADGDGAHVPVGYPQPTLTVESSPGKHHYYWVLREPIDPPDAEQMNRGIIAAIGSDASGYDLTQLLRVPGTHNYKYEQPHSVDMLEVFGPVYTADELLEAFPPPPDEPSMNGSHDTAGEPPVALDAYALRVWAGEDPKYKDHSHEVDRSGTLMRIGRTLFDAGATRAGIVPALAERDETLEYHKYTERRDADKQYNAIVDELEKSGRNPKVKVGAGKDSLMPDPVEFPTHVLPKSIATYIEEAARSIGCPADFIALPVLASCAAAVGNARVLRIKRRWKEPPIFWFVTVGQPSTKKSPALQEGIFPMVDLELGYKDKHAEKVEEHRAEMRKHKKDAKDARTAGKEEPPEPPKPVQRRVLVNDTTTEAIVSILNDNWRGVLLARDELSGWARGMDQYKQGGRGSDRQFWLSTWSASYSSVDRKGAEGTLYVSKPNINIVGGIQPDILPELGKDRNDGFFERVLVAYPVTTPQMWTEDDVSEEAETAYDNLIWNLRHRIRPEKIGENYKPREAGFATDARKRWAEATNELKRELMNPLFPNRLQGAWGKLEAYLARLALLMAMIRVASGYGNRERVVYANISGDDGDDGDDNLQTLVTLKDLEAAIELLAYFKNHIKRVHAQLHSDDSDRALAAEFYSFLHKNGELWKGSLKDLYGKFPEPKPRINEFAKFIYKEAERNPHLSVVSKHTKTGTHLEIVVTVVTSSPGEAL